MERLMNAEMGSPLSSDWILALGIGVGALMWVILGLAGKSTRVQEAGGVKRLQRVSVLLMWTATFFLGVRTWIVEPFTVPTESMAPTIYIGDMLLVNKHAYHWRWPLDGRIFHTSAAPERGDVVVFLRPEDGVRYVKRVMGLPGDMVVELDGVIWVNGRECQHVEAELATTDDRWGEVSEQPRMLRETCFGRQWSVLRQEAWPTRAQVWEVPEGHIWVMGDNRQRSLDSRGFGPIAIENLEGRVSRILWNQQGYDRWLHDMP